VLGTWLESPARFVWKRVLRRKGQNDVYDALTAAIMQRALRPESNCIDVGSHGGVILDEMLRLAPNGSHLAFEPLPHLAAALRRKYEGRGNVTVALEYSKEQRLRANERDYAGGGRGYTFHDNPADVGIDDPNVPDQVPLRDVRSIFTASRLGKT